jgi:hypothetical protein
MGKQDEWRKAMKRGHFQRSPKMGTPFTEVSYKDHGQRKVEWKCACCHERELSVLSSGCDSEASTMEAASISETSINVYQTTRRNIPDDSNCLSNLVKYSPID